MTANANVTIPTAAVLLLAALVMAFLGRPSSAHAEDAVDTALVMAVDISQSVDEMRYRLQMEGIAQALEDPDVIRVVTSGPRHAILFTLIGHVADGRAVVGPVA